AAVALQGTPTVALRVALAAPRFVLSCRHATLCREDAILANSHAERDDALDDAREQCARYGGEASATACARSSVLAACRLESDTGTITVLTYAQPSEAEQASLVQTMAERCEGLGGGFEVAGR